MVFSQVIRAGLAKRAFGAAPIWYASGTNTEKPPELPLPL
jgi:hypothetical protein